VELTKLSTAMAMAPLPLEGARERQSKWEGTGQVRGWRGVLDGVDGLTSGSNAGVRAPNGSQVLRSVGHDGGQSSPLGLSLMSDRATLTKINSQTVVN
jgi:hypothetical protein